MVSQLGSIVEVQSPHSTKCKHLNEINGDDSILYWADLTTEITFYFPQHFASENQSLDMRIFIIWLEDYPEDFDSICNLNQDVSMIGIHPLKNRLFRILLNSNAQR